MDPLLGEILDGRYRLERQVGAGGHGVVYRGTELGTGRPVAIKLLRARAGLDEEQRRYLAARFAEEATTLTRLRHPNIVSALDAGTLVVDGERTPYLVLEWCDGRPLDGELALRGGRAMTLAEALAVVDAVGSALAYAHALGVVHRDVKPANVMMTSAGPRLIDFGIAKLVAPEELPGAGLTRTRTPAGFTPGYAAPEQLAGARTGPWTDVHALGLLFVELVCGAPAYASDPMRALEPVRPSPAAFGVDVGPFEAILQKALALRPDQRFADAGALLEATHAAWQALGAAETRPFESNRALAATEPVVLSSAPPAKRAPLGATPSPRTQRLQRPQSTERTERAAASPPSRRRPRAWGLAVAAVAGLGATAGGLALALRGAAERGAGARSSGSASASVAPPRGSFCALDRAAVEARLAPMRVQSSAESGDTLSAFFSDAVSDPARYSLEVHRAGSAALGRVERLILNSTPSRWDTEGLVYATAPGCVTLLRGPKGPATLRAFEALAGAFAWSERGSSISGPDPIGDRARSRKVPWTAKRLRDLGADELESRLRALGDVVSAEASDFSASAVLRRAEARGVAVLHLSGAAAGLDTLRRFTPGPFSYAVDGDRLVAVHGDPPFRDPAYLDKALAGLGAQVKSSAP